MRSIHDPSIDLDWESGTIKGASWKERAGLAFFRLATVVTNSPERPGFSKLAAGIAKVFPSDKFIRVHFPDETIYQFPYGDAYWSVLCNPGFTYEWEIEGFVRRCARENIDYVFLDCGANFGYWSCRISSEKAGSHKAIAIEASSESYGHIMRNRVLNDNRFDAHHRAISNKSGDQVTLTDTEKHEQRQLVTDLPAGEVGEQVRSITLDRLNHEDIKDKPVVLKLDLEGMEIAALEGGKSWLSGKTLIIYEDHGNDPEHEMSVVMKDQLGMRIFACSTEGQFTEIEDLQRLDKLKTVRRKGYNFFASKDPFWMEFMLKQA